jgi:hypothetical protein
MTTDRERDDQHTAVLMAAETALTSAERTAFLDRFEPHRGAHVADILDMLDDTDSNLDVIEAYYENHAQDVPEPNLLSTATYLCLYLGDVHSLTWDKVKAMIERIRRYLGLTYSEHQSERSKRLRLEALEPLGFKDARVEDGRDLIYHPIVGNVNHYTINLHNVVDWAFKLGTTHGREQLRADLRSLLDVPRHSHDPDDEPSD